MNQVCDLVLKFWNIKLLDNSRFVVVILLESLSTRSKTFLQRVLKLVPT
jgi:hypothetical protein